MTGRVVDKCYKLHGYPSGYKPGRFQQNFGSSANQATDFFVNSSINGDDDSRQPHFPISQEQCRKRKS